MAACSDDKGSLSREATIQKGDLDTLSVVRFVYSTPLKDRAPFEKFALSLNKPAHFVRATPETLFKTVLEGRGDIVIERIFKVPAAGIAFTTPKNVITFVLASAEPTLARDALFTRTVHVHHRAQQALMIPQAKAVVFEKSADAVAEALLKDPKAVGVFDSDLLEKILEAHPGLNRHHDVKENVHVVWATRKGSVQLKKKADAFLSARALTPHKNEVFLGDLDGLRKRGSLRVLTRNNAVTYFLHKGKSHGFDNDLIRMFAKAQNLRVEMVVPAGDLIDALNLGKGDVIAANFSVTPQRKEKVDFSMPYLYVDEVLIKKPGDPLLSVDDLAGKTVTVREASSYRSTLENLNRERAAQKIPPEGENPPAGDFVKMVFAPESKETEDLIQEVARGEIDYTVADDIILSVEQSYGTLVEGAFNLTQAPQDAKDIFDKPVEGARQISFAVRKNAPALKSALDDFVRSTYRGTEYNLLKHRYFGERRAVEISEEDARSEGAISPYDEVIQKYASKYGIDWRLLAALARQESRFNPTVKSWVGAVGLFQVMPSTGAEMGFDDLEDVEQSTHAGVQYLAKMLGEFDESLEYRQRMRFALASYNAGRGHVEDARLLAKELKLDPNRWFKNVEKAMLLLQKPRYFKNARHGYCRGSETVRYVSQIQSRYDVYARLFP